MNVPAPRTPDFSGILFGAAYYAEYQLTDRMDEDLDLMAAAGFTVIRVGESVWSTWEPRDGEFDLEWLLPVLDGAAARGIGVVLGTPTYAIPPWLQVKHPELAGHAATGVPRITPIPRAWAPSSTGSSHSRSNSPSRGSHVNQTDSPTRITVNPAAAIRSRSSSMRSAAWYSA